jgi:hypothetical protein
MTHRQPPRIPKWFLEHLASGRRLESLIGDLDEQFADRQSATWYARQVAAAILIGVLDDIRDNKLLAVRMALMGFGSVLAWVALTASFYLPVAEKWFDPRVNDLIAALLFWYGPLTELWCLGCLATGWLIGRLHPEHLAAMVMMGVLAQLPFTFWLGWSWWLSAFPQPAAYRGPVRSFALMCLVGMPLCTLTGGLIAARGNQLPANRRHSHSAS